MSSLATVRRAHQNVKVAVGALWIAMIAFYYCCWYLMDAIERLPVAERPQSSSLRDLEMGWWREGLRWYSRRLCGSGHLSCVNLSLARVFCGSSAKHPDAQVSCFHTTACSPDWSDNAFTYYLIFAANRNALIGIFQGPSDGPENALNPRNMEPQYAFSIPSIQDDTPLDCRIYHPKNVAVSSYATGNVVLGVKGAIIAHPYAPLGGCYDDHVVLGTTQTLLKQGFTVGTFNFRCVSQCILCD